MFDILFNPQGRVSRKGFVIVFLLPYLVLYLVPAYALASNDIVALLTFIIGLFFLWPSWVAVPVKRLHDLGKTGWLHLIVPLIGILGIVVWIFGIFAPYGDDPEGFGTMLEERFSGVTENAEAMAIMWDLSKDQPLALLGIGMIFGFLIEYLLFAILPGQKGENRFGADPLADGKGYAD